MFEKYENIKRINFKKKKFKSNNNINMDNKDDDDSKSIKKVYTTRLGKLSKNHKVKNRKKSFGYNEGNIKTKLKEEKTKAK